MKKNRFPILAAGNLRIGYKGRGKDTVVAESLDLELRRGELVGLLGPNGSGKSTLIRTLAHMQAPLGGNITLEGEELSRLSSKEVARRVSTVLTDRVTVGNLTVYSVIAFGRSPYTGLLGRMSEQDREVVEWAMEATGLKAFAGRDIARLSDGERQKVMVARALAQDTPLILLDEPTAHLDLPNRVEIVRLLRKLAHETQKAILMSTHELDLALKACDQVWMLTMENGMSAGVPEDLVLNGTFEEVFRRDSFFFDRETGSFKLHEQPRGKITLSGDKIPAFWTARALEREGFEVVEKHKEGEIRAVEEQGTLQWHWRGNRFDTMEALVEHLRNNLPREHNPGKGNRGDRIN